VPATAAGAGAAADRYRRTGGFVFQRCALLRALTAVDNVLAPVLPFRASQAANGRASPLPARSSTCPGPPAAGQPREFRILAGFTEDDVKFGSEAYVLVQTETAPAREEAVELVWPAVWEETRRVLGEGDWRPTIRRVVVAELLG
jgi:hypothetical protein